MNAGCRKYLEILPTLKVSVLSNQKEIFATHHFFNFCRPVSYDKSEFSCGDIKEGPSKYLNDRCSEGFQLEDCMHVLNFSREREDFNGEDTSVFKP